MGSGRSYTRDRVQFFLAEGPASATHLRVEPKRILLSALLRSFNDAIKLTTSPRAPQMRLPMIAAFAVAVSLAQAERSPNVLNPEMPEGGDVTYSGALWITPDSKLAVYLADARENNKHELFAVPVSGGEARLLSPELQAEGDVVPESIRLSADGRQVVFAADAEKDGFFELYGCALSGGAPVKLSGDLGENGTVLPDGLEIAADGSRAVYRAILDAPENPVELFSASLSGGAPVKLSPAMSAKGNVSAHGLAISGDSRTVVFRADREMDNVYALYSVPIGGGDARRISEALEPNGGVEARGVAITPDNAHVVYRAARDGEGIELFCAPLAGGTPRALSGELAPGADVMPIPMHFDGDGNVYALADLGTDGVSDLYRFRWMSEAAPAAITASTATSMVSGFGAEVSGNAALFFSAEHTPATDTQKQRGELPKAKRGNLMMADLATGAVRTLATPGGKGQLRGLFIHTDGASAIFLADGDGPSAAKQPVNLFCAPFDGGAPVRLNPELEDRRQVLGAIGSPDGKWVFYLADAESEDRFELFAAPAAGGDAIRLNEPLGLGRTVLSAAVSPDGKWLLYTANQDTVEAIELYHVDLTKALPAE